MSGPCGSLSGEGGPARRDGVEMDADWVMANGQGRSASWTSNDEPLSSERAGDSSSLGHTFLGCYWE